jgi:hypothetical protein
VDEVGGRFDLIDGILLTTTLRMLVLVMCLQLLSL